MTHDPTSPTRTPPALKNAADLSDDFEYGGIFTGQSNSLPWGKPSEAFAIPFGLEFQQAPQGKDLTQIFIPDSADRAVDVVELLAIGDLGPADVATFNESTQLRMGERDAPERGYADVIASSIGLLRVRWRSLPRGQTLTAGSFRVGGAYQIETVGTTDFTLIGAASNTVGEIFTATGVGSGTGTAAQMGYTFQAGSFVIGSTYQIKTIGTTDYTQIGAIANIPGLIFTATGVGTGTGTSVLSLPGYLVRENGIFAVYENSKVLVPYMPWNDLRPPVEGEPGMVWTFPIHSDYRSENAKIGNDGQRLILPAPYNLPAAVTTFEDTGLFLEITQYEGADGYGISELADSAFGGTGPPVGHPIVSISGETFTFLNEIPTGADFTNAYLLVDWEKDNETKRSWARVASNTTTTFDTDPNSWLGDLIPDAPTFSVVTFDVTDNEVDWAMHGLIDNDRVTFSTTEATPSFSSSGVSFSTTTNIVNWLSHGLIDGDPVMFVGGTLPNELVQGNVYYAINTQADPDQIQLSERPFGEVIDLTGTPVGPFTGFHVQVVPGRIYYVKNATTNAFQIAESPDHPVIDLQGAGQGDTTATRAWVYTVWIPHWRDNPYMWVPGPEFAYPNEDHQPRAPYIHFRARGRLNWAYNVGPGGGPIGEPFEDPRSRFGPLLPFAWRAGEAIGKVLHMVMIGIGSTPLAASQTVNVAAGVYTGRVGWWNHKKFGYAIALEDTKSFLSERLRRLIEFVAPQALIAEGNTKPMRYLSHVHIQGEADGFTVAGREIYRSLLSGFREWVRDICTEGGFSPFANGGKMPFAQPLITFIPYMQAESVSNSDTEGEINDAIIDVNSNEEFSGWVDVEDLPKINDGHYNGGGMAFLGARLAVEILDALEQAMSYGSPVLKKANSRLLEIANNALAYLGQGSRLITELSENTPEARAVRQFWEPAVTELLSLRSWSWAMRIEEVGQVKHRNPNWLYAYALPGRAINPIAVLPPSEEGHENKHLVAVSSPLQREVVYEPEPYAFELGRSPSGDRWLYTNVEEKEGQLIPNVVIGVNELFPERLTRRVTVEYTDKVIDPEQFSHNFAEALTWLLASKLAATLIRGDEGDAVRVRALQTASGYVRAEAAPETNNKQHRVDHLPDWMARR